VKDERQRWVDAGIALAKDPRAVVVCPHCGKANLEVTDQSLGNHQLERHMRCPLCGAYNSLRMSASEPPT
jgi:predicted RNA-binding Zn-ribbon protein involved in translation (DUF1610 family)